MYKVVDDDCNVEVQQKGISAVIKITHQPKAVAVPVVTDNQNITRKKQSKLSGSKDSKKRTKKEKPFYKRVWVRVLAAILALGSCGNETDTAISDETTNPTTSITQTETALETELSFTTEYNLPETSVAEITTIPTTEEYIVPTTIPTVPITEESTVPYMAPVVEDNEKKIWCGFPIQEKDIIAIQAAAIWIILPMSPSKLLLTEDLHHVSTVMDKACLFPSPVHFRTGVFSFHTFSLSFPFHFHRTVFLRFQD